MGLSRNDFLREWIASGLVDHDDAHEFAAALPETIRTGQDLGKELVRAGRLTKFQAQIIYQGKGRSLLLGNYAILDRIGAGGMGQVYLAEHRRMQRRVALKLLPSKMVGDKNAADRFHREVQAAARLSHANIVTAHDADEARGTPYLVMEYVEGQDLKTIVQNQGPLATDQAIESIIQTAQGLQYAHDRGVIHRDIKPANLLRAHDGTIKILDMGLACLSDADGMTDHQLTNTGMVMGTLDFMSPEQGVNTKNADVRSDVYSLGCTLYFLLTAKVMYSGDTAVEKILAHRDQPVPELAKVRNDLPESLIATFQKMVAKQPDERYQSMSEVVTAFERCRRNVGSASASQGASSRDHRQVDDFLGELDGSTRAAKSNQRTRRDKPSNESVLPEGATLQTSDWSQATSLRPPAARGNSRRRQRKKGTKARRGRFPPAAIYGTGGLAALGVLIGLIAMLTPGDEDVVGAASGKSVAIDARPIAEAPRPESATNAAQPAPPAAAPTPPATKEPKTVAVSGAAAMPDRSVRQLDEETIELFNGEDLSGWINLGSADWAVKNHAITSHSGRGALLTEQDFSNFVLELEYWIAPGTNSGVFLRADPQGNPSGADFIEIQLLDNNAPEFASTSSNQAHCSIWKQAAPDHPVPAATEEWHQLRIQALGPEIQIDHDGQSVLKGTLTGPFSAIASGRIGLQAMKAETRFRNIRVRELPIAEPTTPRAAPQVVNIDELNIGEYNTAPWPSRDGRRLYWEGIDDGNVIYTASRTNTDSRFSTPQVIAYGRLPTLSADELELICILPGQGAPMASAVRSSTSEPFPTPVLIDELANTEAPKSPFLFNDDRSLLFQRLVDGAPEFAVAFRENRQTPWGNIIVVPEMNAGVIGIPVTWPSISDDRLRIWYGRGGNRETVLWTAARDRVGEPFSDHQPVSVSGIDLVGRAPRYVPATNELFFARPTANNGWSLSVIKHYRP